jgi:hypothetical protein
MTITEKAAHLKGLIEGMEYDLNTKEGKLFAAIIDLLEDISISVSDLEDEAAALRDYIEELDEDLGSVESDIYETDDDCCCDDDDCDCCDDDCVELTCPACGKEICFDCEEIEDVDTIECPFCKKTLNVIKGEEVDEDEDDSEG